MRSIVLAAAMVALLATLAWAGDAVVVVQDTRTPEAARGSRGASRQTPVRHVALLQNISSQSVRGLRVTVELYDYFGKLLWARSAAPTPSSLKPGETATLSLTTPNLDAHRHTRYRITYRGDGSAR
jgi:hypothetical protein